MRHTWIVLIFVVSIAVGNAGAVAKKTPADVCLSWSEFQYPGEEYRPWTRWWWPGNNVENAELERELNLLAEYFYGGVEVQSFTMGLDPDADSATLARRMSFDSPSFYDHLETVMKSARQKDMQVDITLGSGWPSGGAHVSAQENMQTMLFGEKRVRGPRTIRMRIPGPKKPLFYYLTDLLKLIDGLFHTEIAAYLGDEAELIEVVAGRIVEGRRSLNPVNLSDTVRLEAKSLQVITGHVKGGRLDWDVPSGRWMIIALYRAPDGERPTLTAQSDPGFVVDHLDREASLSHLEHLVGKRTGLQPYYGDPFRAFFNDSFEFKCERHVAEDFLEEFENRRGYDVSPYLPMVMVPGADNFFFEIMAPERKPLFGFAEDKGDAGERIRYDWSLTVSDLFIERYLETAREWAEEQDLQSRGQAYGMDMDIIRAQGELNIPETEQLYAGGSEMFLKIASSAAHLYNREVVSSESMVWAGRDYMTTPLKIKTSADKLFASGVNQVIYHGFTYKKDHSYGEAGWYPWSSPYMAPGVFSSNLSPANPFWKYMKKLNLYVARCQYLLREAEPQPDILVYYPFLGLPSGFSSHPYHREPLFTGHFQGHEPEETGETLEGLLPLPEPEPDARSKWLARAWPALQSMERAGYTWQWVNDHSLAKAEVTEGRIMIRGKVFKAVMLLNAPWLKPESARRLRELSAQDASIVLFGEPPRKQPGFLEYQKNDREVAKAMEKVLQEKNTLYAQNEDGMVRKMAALPFKPSLPVFSLSLPINHAGFKKADGTIIHFLSNPRNKTLSFTLKSMAGCADCFWLDPWNGEVYNQHMRGNCACADTGPISNVVLRPYESLFLVCPPNGKTVFPAVTREKLGKSYVTRHEFFREQAKVKELSSWTLEVKGADVKGEGAIKLDGLEDWRKTDRLRYSSSPGVYRTGFDMDMEGLDDKSVELELGSVAAAAEVKVNGHGPLVLLVPPFRTDITSYLKEGKNYLQVRVIPPLRNRYIGKARHGNKLYKQFKDKEDTLLPAGLIGPARLLVFSKQRVLE